MTNRAPEVQHPLYVRWASVLIALLIILYGLYELQSILVPLTFAALFAALLFPLCRRLERWRVPRIVAILLCLLVALTVIIGLLYAVSMQISTFADAAPQFVEKANDLFNKLQIYTRDHFNISRKQQVAQLRKYLNQGLQEGTTIITSTVATTTSVLTDILLILIFIFFFLLYRDFFRSFFYKVFGHTHRSRVDAVLRRVYTVIKDYLAGMVLVIVIIGTLMTTGLLILGIDYAPFFGFLVACMVLIPYFGIALGSLLPAAYALVTEDNPLKALAVLVVFQFIQMVEGNFITPYVVGSKVSVNPLAAIVVLIFWEKLWGFPGLILALPLTAIVKVIFDSMDAFKPYGFLIGEAEKPRPPIRNLKQLTDQLPRRVKKIGKTEKKT